MKKILTAALVAVAVAGGVVAVMKQSGPAMTPSASAPPAAAAAPAAPAGSGPAGAASVADEALPADGVVVTYFTTDVRCASCHKIEAMAQKAVADHFADDLAAGRVVFRTINIDQPANSHYVGDYNLVSKTVIVSERHGGMQTGWVNLQDVWLKLNAPDDFDRYVVEAVKRALGQSS